MAFSVAAVCPVAAEAPLDDAYYWPPKTSGYVATSAPADAPVAQATDTTSAVRTPEIEYINIQDTTVTAVIKR